MNRGAISVSSDSKLKELESGLCGLVYWTIVVPLPGQPSPDTGGRLGCKMSEAAQSSNSNLRITSEIKSRRTRPYPHRVPAWSGIGADGAAAG
jgi:hypothetical protein